MKKLCRIVLTLLFFCSALGLKLIAGEVDSLKMELFKEKANSLSKLEINLKITEFFIYSNSDSIFFYLNRAKEQASRLEKLPTKVELELIQTEAYYYYLVNEHRKAIAVCNELISKSFEYKNYKRLSFGYNNLSGNYKNLGLRDSMFWAIDTAIYIAEKNNVEDNLGAFYQNKANQLVDDDRFNEGITHYLKAIELHKKRNNEEELALLYYSLGLTFSDLKDFNSADKYFELAIRSHTKDQNWQELLRCHNGIGVAQKNNEKFEEAIGSFEAAIAIGEDQNLKSELLQVYYNLGNTYARIEEFQKAEKFLIEGMNYSKSIDLKIGIKFYAFGLANLYVKLSSPKKAKEYIELYESLAPLVNHSLADKKEYFELKSEYFEVIGNHSKALFYLKKVQMVNDTINENLQDEKILSLEKKYSKTQVESENQLLKKTNQLSKQKVKNRNQLVAGLGLLVLMASISLLILFRFYKKNKVLNYSLEEQKKELKALNETVQKKNSILQNAIEEKDKILYQVSHDFKNQMTSIFGVSELLREEQIPEKIKEHVEIIYEASEDSIVIIDEILNRSKKDWIIKDQVINFDKMIRGIEKGFFPLLENKKLVFEIQAQPDFTFQSNKIFVSRILQNLIANSIKYTKPNGYILVTLEQRNSDIILSVADNGKGFTEKQKQLAFNTRMVEKDKEVESFGFGLLIVKDLVDKLGATIDLESELDKGSKISIKL